MSNQLNIGLLILLLGCSRLAWIGFQARVRKRTDVLHNFNSNDYSDPNAAASIYGLNLLIIGLCGVIVAVLAYVLPQYSKLAIFFHVCFAVICGGYAIYGGKKYAKS